MSEESSRSALIAGYQSFSRDESCVSRRWGDCDRLFHGVKRVLRTPPGPRGADRILCLHSAGARAPFPPEQALDVQRQDLDQPAPAGGILFSVVVTFLIQWPAFMIFQRAIGLPGWVAAGGANLLQMSASYALLRWKVFHASAGRLPGLRPTRGTGLRFSWHLPEACS